MFIKKRQLYSYMGKRFSKGKRSTYRNNKSKIQEVAKKRISILLDEASKNFSKYPERSHRYAEIARKIKLKYKIKMTPEIKRRLCKKCHKFMVPGKNCRIRINSSRLIYTCKECGNIRRFSLK